ncbi:MAG: 50S ribosomal protein L28, partial [bacterium]|nr:50S ribosomal protein L28 [bacterium]
MSQVCELLGIKPLYGNTVSHANNKTKMRQMPNLTKKTYKIPELGRSIQITLSTRATRTIDKQGGLLQAVLQAKEENLSQELLRLRRQVKKLANRKKTKKKA